jgi:NADPH:quinone reductase-like Zn-dependent oxidoreductase
MRYRRLGLSTEQPRSTALLCRRKLHPNQRLSITFKLLSYRFTGLTTWQALFEHGKLETSQKVLIHGGAGGVGSFAIQLAAWKGAFVATTVSEANSAFVRDLGAEQVIDYRKSKFEEIANDADVILDLVGGDTLTRSFNTIKKGGRVITIAANSESNEDPKVKEAFFIVETKREQLIELAKLIDEGIIRPIVSEVIGFEEATKAYFPTKKTGPGKAVLRGFSGLSGFR